jgi:Uma2 family endonuclease
MAAMPHNPSLTSEQQPAWNVALLFPIQGDWSEGDYLALHTNQLVELVDGSLEVLPMPKRSHQAIVRYLFELLRTFVAGGDLGTVLFAPFRVQIRPKTIREPDIMLIAKSHFDRLGEDFCVGADLVVEVVSPDAGAHKRNCAEKRADYAEAGIAEYWIVDPQLQQITILALQNGQYRVVGEFAAGQQATSLLLSGFAADVSATFAAAKKLD